MDNSIRFKDRAEAGKKLAIMLQPYKDKDAVVLALPRGGVPVGREIAKELNCPLDLLIVRKIGHPANPEYAIAATAEDGCIVVNEEEWQAVDRAWFEEEAKRQQNEAKRRRELYLRDKEPAAIEGRIAIIADDGLATGLTMLSAVRILRNKKPAKIIVAVPVAPPDTAEKIKKEADEFICPCVPEFFLGAVGAYYEEFHQLTDEEVIAMLNQDRRHL